MSKGASQKGVTQTYCVFPQCQLLGRDNPNNPIESHTDYIQRGTLYNRSKQSKCSACSPSHWRCPQMERWASASGQVAIVVEHTTTLLHYSTLQWWSGGLSGSEHDPWYGQAQASKGLNPQRVAVPLISLSSGVLI